jgi:spore coat protein U-like protein
LCCGRGGARLGGELSERLVRAEMTMGASAITYGIYQDVGRTQPWGDTMGTTFGATGNGLTQNLPTYGRVPPQTTPAPATYTDTIVVTLTY